MTESKSYERLQAAQTALLVDTKSKFSELQSLFDAAQTDLQSRLLHLASHETEVGVREMNLETKRKELESSEFHLLSRKKLIAQHVDELDLVEKRLEEKRRELEVKEVRVREMEEREVKVRAEMEVKKREVESSKIDLRSLKSLINKNVVHLEGMMELIRERNEKCKMLDIRALKMKSKEIRVRQMEVRVRKLQEREVQVHTLVHECEKQLEMKRGELGLVEKSVAECSSSLKSSESHLHSLKELIDEHVVKLGLMEKRIVERESKSDELDYIEEAIIEKNLDLGECKTRLSSLESHIQEAETRVSELEELIKTRVDQLERVDAFDLVRESGLKENERSDWFEANVEEEVKVQVNKVGDMLNEVRRREMMLKQESRAFEVKCKERKKRKKLVEREDELHRKSLLLEAKELGLKHKDCGCGVRSDGLEGTPRVNSSSASPSGVNGIKINSSLVKTAEPESLPTTRDEMKVRGFLNKNSCGNQFSMSHLVASLFSASIVKIEAAEPSLAIIAAPTYALPNEILISLQSSSDPAKLVLGLMQKTLTEYWTNGDASFKKRIASRHISVLKFLRGVSADVGPHLKEQARNLAAQWKPNLRANAENSLEILGFLLFIDIYGLTATFNEDEIVELIGSILEHEQSQEVCQTHGFLKYITGCILELIKKRKLNEAVKYIFMFNVNDKFPIVPLLDGCVQDAENCSKEIERIQMTLGEKEKAVDGLITYLKAAIQCIKDYKLESQYPSETIKMQIIELNSLKMKWRSLAPCLATEMEQQEERKRKMPDASTSSPKKPKQNPE